MINKLNKFIKGKEPLITFLALVIAFLTWLGFYDIFTFKASQPITSIPTQAIPEDYESLYKKLSELSPSVNITQFAKEFGEADIVHTNDKLKQKDYVFINPDFYLQATTDNDENVISFAVTSRRNDFRPTFKRPDDYNNDVKTITLNKTLFSDLNTYSCFYTQGARRFSYFEGAYEANPGNYQSFYVGINDAGYVDMDSWLDQPSDLFEIKFSDPNNCNQISNKFRESATVNTYLVTAPFVFMPDSKDVENLVLGVNLDEVRVINK